LSRYKISRKMGGKARLVKETFIGGVEGGWSIHVTNYTDVPSFG
jgi:hypothetical protein